jgi:hypothetical protein
MEKSREVDEKYKRRVEKKLGEEAKGASLRITLRLRELPPASSKQNTCVLDT